MTFDPVHPDTQFTGYSHVWRTLDNGGNQAFLEANCTAFEVFFQGNFSSSCGDWTALGPPLNDAFSGFGADRSGGIRWQHSARRPMPGRFGQRLISAACS